MSAPAAVSPEPRGEPAGAGRRPPWLPLALAGAAVLALIAVVVLLAFRGDPAPLPGPAPAAQANAGDPASVDLASMTPAEAADRLFQRVMRSISAGDSAQALTFLPMAIAAYGRIPELDTDARYHLAALEMLAGSPAAAGAQADTILASHPSHLFGLYMRAETQFEEGNIEAARENYGRFLDLYDSEAAKQLPEYQAHLPALAEMRADALAATGQEEQSP